MILQKQIQNLASKKNQHQQFQNVCAECFLNLEKFKLKTNLIGINLVKKDYNFYYQLFQGKNHQKYQFILQRLKQALNSLQVTLKLSQANNLRSLNNILRNYRKRVNLLSNEPTNFKYNKFQKQEKTVIQAHICQDKSKQTAIIKILQTVNQQMSQNDKILNKTEKLQNDKIRQNPMQIIEVIQKTEAHFAKEYDNFQRSMLNTINQMNSHFTKLSSYLNIWQNLCSVKAYEIKTKKQNDMDEMAKQNERRSRGIYEQQTIQDLQRLLKSCSQHSPMRQVYRKRLKQSRQIQNQRKKIQNLAGQMHNKRKSKTGILISKKKDCNILNWYYELNDQKQSIDSFSNQWKKYDGNNDTIQYTLPVEQIKQDKKTSQEFIQSMNKSPATTARLNMKNQTYYDRFGLNQNFSLTDFSSNLTQKRIQFQSEKQVQLQILEDRRKREFIEKQMNADRQNQRRQTMHIGYKYLHQKQQIQNLISKDYNVEFIPDPINMDDQSSFDFTDSQQEVNQRLAYEKIQEKQRNLSIAQNIKNMSVLKSIENQRVDLKKQTELNEKISQFQKKQQKQNQSVLQQQIKSYFEYLQIKCRRIKSNQSRTLKCLYYDDLDKINWDEIQQVEQTQRIFIVLPNILIRLQKFVGANSQRVKATIYHFNKDIDENESNDLKQKIKDIYYKNTLVTYKFEQFATQQSQKQCGNYCMLGMLIVLIYEQELNEDDSLQDYQNKGRQLMQEYRLYNEDQKENKNIYTIKEYSNKPISKINYKIYKNEEGFQFQRMKFNQINNQMEPVQIEMFKINTKKNQNEDSDDEENENNIFSQRIYHKNQSLKKQKEEDELKMQKFNQKEKNKQKKEQVSIQTLSQQKNSQNQGKLSVEGLNQIELIRAIDLVQRSQNVMKKSDSREELKYMEGTLDIALEQQQFQNIEKEQHMDERQSDEEDHEQDDYVSL